MNSTHRGLNRTLILLVGLILLALGVGAAALALVPAVSHVWTALAPEARTEIAGDLRSSAVAGTTTSWVSVGVAVVLLLGILLLIAFVFRQGNGRTGTLLRRDEASRGSLVVDTAVASTLLESRLAESPELISAKVLGFEVRGTPALKIAVTGRRGVSPRDVVTAVEESVRAFDALLGTEIPALLQISGGFRTRVRTATRVQ